MKKLMISTRVHPDFPDHLDTHTLSIYNAMPDDEFVEFAKKYYSSVVSSARVMAFDEGGITLWDSRND